MQHATKRLLLVDDRAKYSDIISDFFTEYGYLVDRAVSAKQGIGMLKDKGLDHYRVVVTDITMEHQLAGIELIYFLFKKKYAGTVVMASTGFDIYLGMFFSKLFMGIFGVHYLIPKTTVISRDFAFYPARPGSSPLRKFVEVPAS
ncbi:MAG: response regulator [Deltaproteobacteria bacterium]|nr:response regulator [Candidatus Zymogenaceae bacterium]